MAKKATKPEPTAGLDAEPDVADLPADDKLPRQKKEDAPPCPKCSTDKEPVRCVAYNSSQFTTYYRCPNKCGFLTQRPRPQAMERWQRQQQQPPPENLGAR